MRRPAIDLGTRRGERARDELRPVIGKRTLVEDLATGYTALDAIAFFDRATGEIHAQLAALARAIASGDRVLGVTATGS
ncbi:MAG TPA: hypothetical protein VN253_05095, partial [Kofleriaceae bacterium]|nr:hypothetical protein [Kofleriaceae bacterium]